MFNALNGHLALCFLSLHFISMPSILAQAWYCCDKLLPAVRRRHQVMQKAFIKETYYCTILNRAPAKLAPARMAQLSTRNSRDPGETGLEM
ncbi:hypothetical protein QQF64_002874 [Cirrhinus molitorella]|uniref:Secreted protein n=1 Tax=Cirrhinus molitorella TaxID=172907 RepID=A0ABR3MRF3_9TELE